MEEEKKMYRLRYSDPNNPHQTSLKYPVFTLPKNISEEEAFLILSYLIDNISNTYSYDTTKNTDLLVEMLNLLIFTNWHFVKVSEGTLNYQNVIELFIIHNRENKFGYDRVHNAYFDWYTPNVSKEIIENILAKIEEIPDNKLTLKKI